MDPRPMSDTDPAPNETAPGRHPGLFLILREELGANFVFR